MKKLTQCSPVELIDVMTHGSHSAAHDACHIFYKTIGSMSMDDKQHSYELAAQRWNEMNALIKPCESERQKRFDAVIYFLWKHGVQTTRNNQWISEDIERNIEHFILKRFYIIAGAFSDRDAQGLINFPNNHNVFQYMAHKDPDTCIKLLHEHIVNIDQKMFSTTYMVALQWLASRHNGASALELCCDYVRNHEQAMMISSDIVMNAAVHLMEQGRNLADDHHLDLGKSLLQLHQQYPWVGHPDHVFVQQMQAIDHKVCIQDALCGGHQPNATEPTLKRKM